MLFQGKIFLRGSDPHPMVKKGCFNMCLLALPVAGPYVPSQKGVLAWHKLELYSTETKVGHTQSLLPSRAAP